jgi:3',5'-cyclic AMP phosphodiesterase CpdA
MANHSRRRWLAGSAASLAALHWCELPLPAAEGLKQFSFAIVSDTHLGRANGAAPERQWRQAIAEINESSADFVLHLGDVVDSGRPEQYPIYAATRGDLKQPIYEVPGNHDPHPLFEKHVRTPIDAAVDHAGVRFLLLGNAHTDSHLGFITPEQIAWLDKQCADAAASDLQIVVACHVPVHTNSHPDRGWHVKPDDGQRAL